MNRNKVGQIRGLAACLAVTATSLALSLEICVWVVFVAFPERYPSRDPRKFVVDDSRILTLAHAYDPYLGWNTNYLTPFGERPRASPTQPILAAVFGDSFAHCDEVEDDETWEESLSRLSGYGVLNFGVPGYGMDQAVLKMEKLMSSGNDRFRSLKVALLAFSIENINRIENIFRPFYFRETGLPLSKPMFLCVYGECLLEPNPIERLSDLAKLGDPNFIETMGVNDRWYRRLPKIKFPASRFLLTDWFWAASRSQNRGELVLERARELWGNPSAKNKALYILGRFIGYSRSKGIEPVVVVVPHRSEAGRRDEVPLAEGHEVVGNWCANNGVLCVDETVRFAEMERGGRGGLFSPGGHLSDVGNREISIVLRNLLVP